MRTVGSRQTRVGAGGQVVSPILKARDSGLDEGGGDRSRMMRRGSGYVLQVDTT